MHDEEIVVWNSPSKPIKIVETPRAYLVQLAHTWLFELTIQTIPRAEPEYDGLALTAAINAARRSEVGFSKIQECFMERRFRQLWVSELG